MTRENLIQAIYDNTDSWSCKSPCPHTMGEENPQNVCWNCSEKLLSEYEQQIRAEAIEEVKRLAQHYLIGSMDLENATKYGNKNAEQQDNSYGTLMRYEIANCVDDFMDSVERLRGQNV